MKQKFFATGNLENLKKLIVTQPRYADMCINQFDRNSRTAINDQKEIAFIKHNKHIHISSSPFWSMIRYIFWKISSISRNIKQFIYQSIGLEGIKKLVSPRQSSLFAHSGLLLRTQSIWMFWRLCEGIINYDEQFKAHNLAYDVLFYP